MGTLHVEAAFCEFYLQATHKGHNLGTTKSQPQNLAAHLVFKPAKETRFVEALKLLSKLQRN